MRYESLIFEGKSETPEKLLLTDKSLSASNKGKKIDCVTILLNLLIIMIKLQYYIHITEISADLNGNFSLWFYNKRHSSCS